MFSNKELIDKIMELDGIETRILIIDLIECGKINFIDIATAYVEKLQKEKKRSSGSIATLGLMLASYCINDPSPGGKNSRKHLFESGAYTGTDGSLFGKQLSEEFKTKNEI